MKKFVSSIGMTLVQVSCIVTVAVLLAACSKFNDDETNNNTPVAGLRAFNLAPDQSLIGITLSGNNFTNNPLAYTIFTGSYQRI